MYSLASLIMTRSSSSSSDTASLPASVSGDLPQDAAFSSSIGCGKNSFGYNHHRRYRSDPPTLLPRSSLKIKTQDESLQTAYGSGSSGIRSPRQMAVASFRSFSAGMRSLSPRSFGSPISSKATKARRKAEREEEHEIPQKHWNGILDTISSYFYPRRTDRQIQKPKKVDFLAEEGRARVRFDNVSIREYNLDVGVHPSVRIGPAVTLGWKYEDSIQDMKLNEYEMMRADRRRGPFREMTLSSAERTRRLRASGISHEEIEECMSVVEEAKRKRAKTLKRLHHRLVEERLEGMAKGIKTVLGLRKPHKKAEKELWADAETYFAVRA